MRRLLCVGLLLLPGACALFEPTGQRYVVFFRGSSAQIEDAAEAVLVGAADWAKKHPDMPVTVASYADPYQPVDKRRRELAIATLIRKPTPQTHERFKPGAYGIRLLRNHVRQRFCQRAAMDRPPHTKRHRSAIHRLRPTPRRRLDTVTDPTVCCMRCRGCQRPHARLASSTFNMTTPAGVTETWPEWSRRTGLPFWTAAGEATSCHIGYPSNCLVGFAKLIVDQVPSSEEPAASHCA